MAETFEKGYAMSGHSPLLRHKLMFPLSSSAPVTVAAMQTPYFLGGYVMAAGRKA